MARHIQSGMKIKLDENIPVLLAPILASLSHDVDTVRDEGLLGMSDQIVWEETCREGRFFITQDLDFSDFRKFEPGTNPGILLVRMDNPSLSNLLNLMRETLTSVTLQDWAGCNVTISERKCRILRPVG